MARARSPKVAAIKEKLITRIRSGYYRPGERLFSNRGLAAYFGISYQTAHRLMRELQEEGWIERREYSGSYAAGTSTPPTRVALWFSSRARVFHSFGDRILRLVTAELDRAAVRWEIHWVDPDRQVRSRTPSGAVGAGGGAEPTLPVIWECPHMVGEAVRTRGFAVLINDRPPPGLAKSHIDSVSVDDFSGGVSAAHLILGSVPGGRGISVLQGPSRDRRNVERVQGLLSVIPNASVHSAESWAFEAGYECAADVILRSPAAVFCTNDRLASALLGYCRDRGEQPPVLVGFDNAPVSEELDFTTIAIPWQQMAHTIVQIAQRRLAGDTQTSVQYILNTVPIVRDAFFFK
ncbi:MAG: substrate-binding domain-containing protein [Spirochaetota bacterium]